MSLSTGEMSPADIAAVTGTRNGDGFMGGNGAWWIIILFLFAFCGGWGMASVAMAALTVRAW